MNNDLYQDEINNNDLFTLCSTKTNELMLNALYANYNA